MNKRATLQDKKATGGKNALAGFDFQRAYAFVKLVESYRDPEFTAILIEGAEDVEVRLDKHGEVERISIQVKNHRVTTNEAKEIIANFVKLDTDSPHTWTSFVIACTELDDALKTIYSQLEDYRRLCSPKFYSKDNQILAQTQTELKCRIREIGFPVDFVCERVSFEPNLVSYADIEWVRPRIIESLQKDIQNLSYDVAQQIYLELGELIAKSTRSPIGREQIEAILNKYEDLSDELAFSRSRDILKRYYGDILEKIPVEMLQRPDNVLLSESALPAPESKKPAVLSHQSSTKVRLSKDILVDYDLVPLRNEFSLHLKYSRRAYAFTVGGPINDESIMKNYILERIKRCFFEFRRSRKSDLTILECKLSTILIEELDHATFISNAILNQVKGISHLEEIFQRYDEDLLLTLWNYDLGAEDIKKAAEAFWEKISQTAVHAISDKPRFFIVILIDLMGYPPAMKNIYSLPLPNEFELEDLKGYLTVRFSDYENKLDKKMINRCILRIEKEGGQPVSTYRAFEEIQHLVRLGQMEA